jgi:hypothetical protein
MDALYRWLLYLYPPLHRRAYDEEMRAVFLQAKADTRTQGWASQLAFCVREIFGLLAGALREHFGVTTGGRLLLSRRFTMRSEFRFPKSTTALMFVILGGVILAIEKATSIAASIPHANPTLPPIHPVPPTFPQAIAVMFAVVYVSAAVGWAVLFALRRSGVHRLGDLDTASRRG